MARRRKTTKRRYKAPAKRRVARAPKRSRKTRAIRRRKPARRNPKGFFGQPAVQYGIAATAGASLALALNERKDLYYMGQSPSLIAAALTILIGKFFLKRKNSQYAYAAGVGMFLPTVGSQVGEAVSKLIPAKSSASNGAATTTKTETKGYTAMPQLVRTSTPGAKYSAVMASTSKMKSA